MLITGAGGLGIHAVQIAHAVGAYVIASTRSQSKVRALEDAGAHTVVVAADGQFAKGVREATGGRGVDVTIDTVGGAVFHEVRRSVVMAAASCWSAKSPGPQSNWTWGRSTGAGLQIRSAVSTSRRQLEMALRLVPAARSPDGRAHHAARRAAAAHRMVEDNAVIGRIVLIPEVHGLMPIYGRTICNLRSRKT